jgi:hypothetical protein
MYMGMYAVERRVVYQVRSSDKNRLNIKYLKCQILSFQISILRTKVNITTVTLISNPTAPALTHSLQLHNARTQQSEQTPG